MKYPIVPVPKPRQTRSDVWKKRPPVLRYRAFADECRARKVQVPECGAHITFVLPMPASWSNKKRDTMDGQPHQSKPDSDNLVKALLDAVLPEDCAVWDYRVTKLWGEVGAIIIQEMERKAA